MKISRSTGYALVATGYIAQNYQDGAVLAARVSKEYSIPLEYLLKILQQLVRAHVLRSKRGPRGGFFLARPAEKITMLEIIEAVEGPLASGLHLSATRDKFATKAQKTSDKAFTQARNVLKAVKLSDLI